MTIKITTSNTQKCGRRRKEFETTELLLLLQKLFSVERVYERKISKQTKRNILIPKFE